MSVVRMNITVPKELAEQINKFTPPRKRSLFVTEALRQKVKEIQHERTGKAMEEGYKTRKAESQSIAKEFAFIDLEGWDEY